MSPKQWLTAAVYNWGPYYLRRVQAAINGKWKPGFYYGTIKDGFTGLAPYRPKVSAKTKALIAAKRKAIVSGKFSVFQGPLYDQKGKLVVPKGKTLRCCPTSTRCSGSSRAWSARSRASCRQARSLGESVPVRPVSERGAGASGASPPLAVRMRGITKRFPGVVASEDAHFEARVGEVHALLGENGAGKTTLSNILTGLYRPDEGDIDLYGEPVHFHSPRDALDAGMGTVPSTSGS